MYIYIYIYVYVGVNTVYTTAMSPHTDEDVDSRPTSPEPVETEVYLVEAEV
jgi:hypothetical protein